MSFITDPNLDRLMGRRAEQGGAFAALLCLAQLALIEGGPHGLNATHAEEFNRALLDFLAG